MLWIIYFHQATTEVLIQKWPMHYSKLTVDCVGILNTLQWGRSDVIEVPVASVEGKFKHAFQQFSEDETHGLLFGWELCNYVNWRLIFPKLRMLHP
jgi:hypothetical protein